ncbi:MAG: tetratricopeptide repeat protein [Planctomycetes bacterium]|nr:tetratricopeptide repeat protein [Planctomycetota bacterium]
MPPPRSALCLLALGGACAGVSVRPQDADPSTLPVVTLAAAEAAELARLVEQAIDRSRRGEHGAAERLARQALALDPRAARARAVLGMAIYQRAAVVDPPDLMLAHAAEAEVVLAERLAPGDPFVGAQHARLLQATGHLSAAAAVADAALARTAAAPPAERFDLFAVAATCRYELGEERAAVPHLQACLAVEAGDASTWFRLGACLLRIAEVPSGPRPNSLVVAQNQADAAARAFRRCAELSPDDADAWLAVGAALLRAADLAAERRDQAVRDERRDAAEQQFRAAALRFPAAAEAPFRLGVVAEGRGDVAAAQAAYDEALARDPHHLGSLLNLAALRSREPDGEPAARELLQRALRTGEQRGTLTRQERDRIRARLQAPQAPMML